jgi:hypothetical protein
MNELRNFRHLISTFSFNTHKYNFRKQAIMSSIKSSTTRRRPRVAMSISILSFLICCTQVSLGFLPPLRPSFAASSNVKFGTTATQERTSQSRSNTALNVWWFGGTEQSEVNSNDDSCELVAVRIERTSANSRRIAGDITVPAKLEDVWSILTDYDRLAIHVPNLKESRVLQRNSKGEQGDGAFRCRLFQVGAQRIIGFDFSASVTMDMTERVLTAAKTASESGHLVNPQERKIAFKCVDSQFFSTFDGEWKVKEQMGPDGEVETLCSYVVDVRPKGPVPVAALEWRIREDVPTNLRAVKAATIGSLQQALHQDKPVVPQSISTLATSFMPTSDITRTRNNGRQYQPRLANVMGDWDRDETMGKYL